MVFIAVLQLLHEHAFFDSIALYFTVLFHWTYNVLIIVIIITV